MLKIWLKKPTYKNKKTIFRMVFFYFKQLICNFLNLRFVDVELFDNIFVFLAF